MKYSGKRVPDDARSLQMHTSWEGCVINVFVHLKCLHGPPVNNCLKIFNVLILMHHSGLESIDKNPGNSSQPERSGHFNTSVIQLYF